MPSLLKKAKKFYKKHLRGGGHGQQQAVQQPQPAVDLADMAADSEASEELSTLRSFETLDAESDSELDEGLFDDLAPSSAEETWDTAAPQGGERGSWLAGARAAARPKYDQLASIGDRYVGEHDEAGWRYAGGERPNAFSKIMTTAFDDADRDAHRIEVDDEGRLMQGGAALDTSGGRGGRHDSEADSYIFAMGADGDLQAADQLGEQRQRRGRTMEAIQWKQAFEQEHGREPTAEEVEAEWGRDALALQCMHHSSFFAGADVAGAGELKVADGRVKHITPNSGHYQPGLEQTTNVANELAGRGADLTSAMVDVSRLDARGKARTDAQGHLIGETFHSGEVLAAQGNYGALMGKKDMLAELKRVSPDPGEDLAMSEFDVTEDLEQMHFDQGVSYEECERYARDHGWELLFFDDREFAHVEPLVGGANIGRSILDRVVGDRPSVTLEPREFAPTVGRVVESAPQEEPASGYSAYSGYTGYTGYTG